MSHFEGNLLGLFVYVNERNQPMSKNGILLNVCVYQNKFGKTLFKFYKTCSQKLNF